MHSSIIQSVLEIVQMAFMYLKKRFYRFLGNRDIAHSYSQILRTYTSVYNASP